MSLLSCLVIYKRKSQIFMQNFSFFSSQRCKRVKKFSIFPVAKTVNMQKRSHRPDPLAKLIIKISGPENKIKIAFLHILFNIRIIADFKTKGLGGWRWDGGRRLEMG